MPTKNKKLILLILSIILIMGFFLSIIYIKNSKKSKLYQFQNKTYYEVTLKPNTYFPTNKIESNNYYLANAIKSVDIYFDYNLKTKENINYSYDITATLKSYANNGTELIWTKDFNLKNINNLNDKEINIKENYNLDYTYFVNYVKSFQEYYNIKTETYLYVKLNIKINNETNPYVLLTIPISDNVIEITMNEETPFLKNHSNNLSKIIAAFLIVIIIIILISKVLFHKNNEDALLKEYHDLIISTQNKPNLNSNNLYLTNLKDLLSIAINNNTNIFNYNNNYYTIIDNTYYIYFSKKT